MMLPPQADEGCGHRRLSVFEVERLAARFADGDLGREKRGDGL